MPNCRRETAVEAMSKIRAAIMRADHPAFGSLQGVLSSVPDLAIVAELRDYAQARHPVAALLPDLVIVPATLRGQPVWPTLHHLRQHCPGASFIVIAGAASELAAMPSTALQAEACILWSDVTPVKLRHVLHSILTDRFVLGSHELAEAFFDLKRSLSHRSIPPLAPRERQVLEGAVKGESDQEIAARLNIKPATVAVHLRHIREKVGASNRSQLCYLAGKDAIE